MSWMSGWQGVTWSPQQLWPNTYLIEDTLVPNLKDLASYFNHCLHFLNVGTLDSSYTLHCSQLRTTANSDGLNTSESFHKLREDCASTGAVAVIQHNHVTCLKYLRKVCTVVGTGNNDFSFAVVG